MLPQVVSRNEPSEGTLFTLQALLDSREEEDASSFADILGCGVDLLDLVAVNNSSLKRKSARRLLPLLLSHDIDTLRSELAKHQDQRFYLRLTEDIATLDEHLAAVRKIYSRNESLITTVAKSPISPLSEAKGDREIKSQLIAYMNLAVNLSKSIRKESAEDQIQECSRELFAFYQTLLKGEYQIGIVGSVQSFDEYFAALRYLGPVRASNGTLQYPGDIERHLENKVIPEISKFRKESIRARTVGIMGITRTYGLQRKALGLILAAKEGLGR